MAQLATAGSETTARPTPAHTQLLAVAWLRWRIFINVFRRAQAARRSIVGLVFIILIRVIFYGWMTLIAGAIIGGCGFAAWTTIAHHHPDRLVMMFAAIFLFWQFISLNGLSIAAAISTFDPSTLLRFPLPFGRYLLLRTLLGLLTPTTICGSLALLATAVGAGIADHALIVPALAVCTLYTLMNVFFTRMIGAWVERWLSTRRAREIFGVITLLLVVGSRLLSVHGSDKATQNPGLLLTLLHLATPVLHWLPPGLAVQSLFFAGHPYTAIAHFIALLAYTALFFSVFAIRLRKQFHGEDLSETRVTATPVITRTVADRTTLVISSTTSREIPSPLAACLRKEWLMLRGNSNQLIGLLTPLFFIYILSARGGIFSKHPAYALPGAIAYALFGLLIAQYNLFGIDGPGVQLYLMAPVRLRDIVLAKNILSLAMLGLEALLAFVVACLLAHTPIPVSTITATLFWTVFLIFINLTVGTLRSIYAPTRFDPSKVRIRASSGSGSNGLIVAGVLFGSLTIAFPILIACRHYGHPWYATSIFAILAIAVLAAYFILLDRIERILLDRRDLFAEALCKN